MFDRPSRLMENHEQKSCSCSRENDSVAFDKEYIW